MLSTGTLLPSRKTPSNICEKPLSLNIFKQYSPLKGHGTQQLTVSLALHMYLYVCHWVCSYTYIHIEASLYIPIHIHVRNISKATQKLEGSGGSKTKGDQSQYTK